MDDLTPCPDPELLSAYLDTGLDPARREAVACHLAECDRCRGLVAEVIRIQDGVPGARPEPEPMVSRGSGGLRRTLGSEWAGQAVTGFWILAGIAVIGGAAASMLREAPDSDRARLASAAGEERTTAARLSGPFPYAPLRAPVRALDGEAALSRPWMLVAAAGEIREAHHADLSAASQHATGVAALLVGEYHEAIRALTAAADIAPSDAGVLADLAAAYHERARLGGRADDLPRALSAAERAIAADPARAEAWFNRALAISAIAPRDLAREAWEAYLAREDDPEWRDEARQRIEALTPSGDEWPVVLARLQGVPEQASIDAAVRQHTSRTREFLERELFPAWATAVLANGDAETPLGQARMFADAMSRLTGDQIARDTVIAIDRAEAAGNARALAEAVTEFVRVRNSAIASPGRFSTELAASSDRLAALEMPMHLEAAIDAASAHYYSGRYAEADQLLAVVELTARRESYSDVLAELTWLAGMIAFAQGRLGDAQHLYEQTLETASAMGDTERTAGANLLLANLFYYVGDSVRSWQHRAEAAMNVGAGSETARTAHGLLVSAAGDAHGLSSPEAAFVLQTAALRTATGVNEATLAEAYAQRASTLNMLGRDSEASDDLSTATEILLRVPVTPLTLRVQSLLLSTEAELFLSSDPERAARAAGRALELLAQRGDRLRVAQLSLSLSRARLAQGDRVRARNALHAGIAAFDEARRSLSGEGRLTFSERSWGLFEQAIDLALGAGDIEMAFAYSERGRARTIVESQQWGVGERPSLAAVQAALSDDVALLLLNQFDEKLVSWLVLRGTVTSATVPLGRQRAGALVSAYSSGMTTGGGGTHASGELFDALVRPHLPAIGDARLLVVVPDSPYSSVAFAGLLDRRRSRFLIEDVALATSPSATVFVRATARAARQGDRLSALVLGAPTLSHGNTVAALPGSRDEATEIAALYASAVLRAGVSATPSRLLDDGPGQDVVHVAAHGVTNAQYPLLSRLMLADAPGQPHSGGLFASEVARRDFSGTGLVVLAACDSGGGPEARGEGALSLARAFLAAGVPTVVSALGPLDDNLARQMFVDFHRAYERGTSAAESLQQVQVQALQRTGRQPGAWARLAVFGASHTTTPDRTEGDSREP